MYTHGNTARRVQLFDIHWYTHRVRQHKFCFTQFLKSNQVLYVVPSKVVAGMLAISALVLALRSFRVLRRLTKRGFKNHKQSTSGQIRVAGWLLLTFIIGSPNSVYYGFVILPSFMPTVQEPFQTWGPKTRHKFPTSPLLLRWISHTVTDLIFAGKGHGETT